ncbi:MAG: hypothetical protein FGM22_10340, partial [Burkholderiaceae bacterium]|nr:hypothetical protein [Burkholderiaceae bacterium]
SIVDNIDHHAAKVIPYHEPKPTPRGMQRDKAGHVITPAEIVLFGEGMAGDRYETMMRAASIDPNVEYQRPPSLFTFDGHPLLTMENISVISGKAKSRKTGFASVLASMTISPNSQRTDWQRMKGDRLRAERPYQRSGVMIFDTEQGSHHVWATARRILYMADRDNGPCDQLRIFALRDFTPVERLEFIAETIDRHAHECGLVIIDGIRDVVMNINSEDEATLMTSWLLTITKRYSIHVSCVLHENKGSDTLRGHIGTELQNKAEAVFTVTKGTTKATRDMSAVETSVSRNKGMERIGMDTLQIEQPNGVRLWVPVLIDDGRAERIGKATEGVETADESVTDGQHGDILRAVWADDPTREMAAQDLREAITAHAGIVLGRAVSRQFGRDAVAHWLNITKWITDNGKQTKGRSYRLTSTAPIRAIRPEPMTSQPAARPAMQLDFVDADGDQGADDVPF